MIDETLSVSFVAIFVHNRVHLADLGTTKNVTNLAWLLAVNIWCGDDILRGLTLDRLDRSTGGAFLQTGYITNLHR